MRAPAATWRSCSGVRFKAVPGALGMGVRHGTRPSGRGSSEGMVNDVDPVRLRRLAEVRGAGAQVLSIYIDRDPQSFASPRALQSEAHSAVDEASRRIEEADLDHDALVAARADVERVRELLLEVDPDERETIDPDLDLKGARGLAILA